MSLDLSIVMPAYNEVARIRPSLEVIRSFLIRHSIAAEVLVVDDGSTDGTAEVVRSLNAEFEPAGPLRILQNPGNRGKGYSVRHGMIESRGARVLFTDTDLSSPIEEYFKLAAPLDRGEASIAFGSRALPESRLGVRQSRMREYSGRSYNLAVRILAGLPFRDTQCGFKLFTREAADAVFPLQTIDGFGFDVEVLYIARKLGIRMAEVPVAWSHVEGSHVKLLNGARAFWDILRVRYQDLTGGYHRTHRTEANLP